MKYKYYIRDRYKLNHGETYLYLRSEILNY